jgi:hypothetical protein
MAKRACNYKYGNTYLLRFTINIFKHKVSKRGGCFLWWLAQNWLIQYRMQDMLYCSYSKVLYYYLLRRILLEKLTGLQLVKKFPAFYETQKFITALTSARHLPPSWASPFQSISPHPTSWISILIFSSHLRLRISHTRKIIAHLAWTYTYKGVEPFPMLKYPMSLNDRVFKKVTSAYSLTLASEQEG